MKFKIYKYLCLFNLRPKFVRKPKGLKVFKSRVLTKFGAEKENNRNTVYNQKLHVFYASEIISALNNLI
jgi:hypothetical protein